MKKLLPFLIVFFSFSSVAYGFSDVSESYKYSEAVDFVESEGIVNGYDDGTYKPSNLMNRAELLKIIMEAVYDDEAFEVIDSYSSIKCFDDVPVNEWYTKYVCSAKAAGIIVGYEDGSFRPEQTISLVETLKIVMESFGFDYEESTPWYHDLVGEASWRNFIPLDFTNFTQDVSRGQMADMITRILKYQSNDLSDYLSGRFDCKVSYDSLLDGVDVEDLESCGGEPDPDPEPDNTDDFRIEGNVTDEMDDPIVDATASFSIQILSSGKIYRYGSEEISTDVDGDFVFTMSDIQELADFRNLSAPYSIFVRVGKTEYLTEWVYDFEESPKLIDNETWDISVALIEKPERITMSSDRFEVLYYPGEESCADIAMAKMEEFYPQVEEVLGVTPDNDKTIFTFNTPEEQGYGDWLGGQQGIWGVCQPWTDNIEDSEIDDMWDSAIPHELGHHFISGIGIPYWSNEGLAQYLKFQIADTVNVCDPSSFLPVQELTGENMPYYNTAACFWQILEDESPGFVKGVVQSAKSVPLAGESDFFDLIEFVYGEDLTDFMIENFHYEFDSV